MRGGGGGRGEGSGGGEREHSIKDSRGGSPVVPAGAAYDAEREVPASAGEPAGVS